MKMLVARIAVTFSILLGVVGLIPAVTYAASGTCPNGDTNSGAVNGTSKTQVLGGLGETATDCSGKAGGNAVKATTEILSWIVGLAAVIMVIVAGFHYITSGGDSGKVSSAKSTLVYAAIGLAVAALAQFLVHFVINRAR